MKIYKNIEQGTDEWLNIRLGKITGSKADVLKMTETSQTKKKYLLEKAAELITGQINDEQEFKNLHIQRGNELEPKARKLYEEITGNEVEEVGFIEESTFLGCSPDGLIDNRNGIIEIKCKDHSGHISSVLKTPTKDFMQIQFSLLVSNTKYCDYINYNEKFFPDILNIKRIEKDEKTQELLKEKIKTAEKLIKEYISLYQEKINLNERK